MGRDGKRSGIDRREEVLAHIRLEADRLEAAGLSPADATRQARATFGRHPSLDPRLSEARSGWAPSLARDVRFGIRRLLASPLSTATIVVSLVVGIGANTAIFSLADQVLFRTLPVEAPDEIVQLRWDGNFVGGGRGFGALLPHPLYEALPDGPRVFGATVARSPGRATLETPAGRERATVELVTGTYFSMLGVRPHLGRLIGPDDDVLDGDGLAVLSWSTWGSRFGSDPDVVGRELRVNGRPMTVIGVAPSGFHGTDWSVAPAVWLPMSMNGLVHSWGGLDEPRVRFQHVFARLAPGVSRTEADAALQPWFDRYLIADMELEGWPAGLSRTEVESYLASDLRVDPGGQGDAARMEELRLPVLVLSGATALLLLLACLNVANLSLARVVARRRDSSIRSALGASRGRIAVERLVEAGLLSSAGAGAALALAPTIGRWLLSWLETDSGTVALTPGLDGRVLAIATAVAVIATLISGVGPAWFDASVRPMGALRLRNPAPAGLRFRSVLVVGQVALALVLLVGANLFARSLEGLRSRGPGYPTEGLAAFTITPSNEGYSMAESRALIGRVQAGVEALPGVRRVGVALWPMLTGSGWNNTMLVEGEGRFVTEEAAPMNAVSPGFFATLGVRVVRGRDFDGSDRGDPTQWTARTAIVSESFVERYLPDQDPLGVRVDFGGEPSRAARMEIVGVVEDYAEHGLADPGPQVYFPIWARPAGSATLYVRAEGDPSAVLPALRAAVREIDGTLTITDLLTMDGRVDRLLVFERMLAALGRAFALFGTALVAIGLYGVLAFAARTRTREVAIRVALGAPRESAARLLIGEAAKLVATGVALAVPAILVLGPLVRSVLVGIDPFDPSAFVIAVAVLLVVSIAASAPAVVRMARTSPLEALRAD